MRGSPPQSKRRCSFRHGRSRSRVATMVSSGHAVGERARRGLDRRSSPGSGLDSSIPCLLLPLDPHERTAAVPDRGSASGASWVQTLLGRDQPSGVPRDWGSPVEESRLSTAYASLTHTPSACPDLGRLARSLRQPCCRAGREADQRGVDVPHEQRSPRPSRRSRRPGGAADVIANTATATTAERDVDRGERQAGDVLRRRSEPAYAVVAPVATADTTATRRLPRSGSSGRTGRAGSRRACRRRPRREAAGPC